MAFFHPYLLASVPGSHTVGICAIDLFSGDAQEYLEQSENGEAGGAYYDKVVHHMLDRLDFSVEEADKIIHTYTLEELRGVQDGHPLVEILRVLGMDAVNGYLSEALDHVLAIVVQKRSLPVKMAQKECQIMCVVPLNCHDGFIKMPLLVF